MARGVEKQRSESPHSGRMAIVLLLIGAVGLRLAVVFATRNDIVFRVPYLDAAFYHEWASSLASHAGDFADAYFLGPLYPHVLSWIYRIGWTDILIVRLLQTALGCINIALVLMLGQRLHSRSSGFFAAALLAFHGTAFFYEGILVMETLMMTLVLGACTLLLLAGGSRVVRASTIIVAGFLLGSASLGRGTVLLLLPVLLWILRSPLKTVPQQRALPFLLIVTWIVTLIPAMQHNAARGVPWTLTTNAGVNFYAGNQAGSRGRFRPPPNVTFFEEAGTQQLAPPSGRPALTTAAVAGTERAADSAYWFRQAQQWMTSHPMDFVVLLLRKAALVLQGHEIGQIESPEFHRQRLPALGVFWVGWSLLISLAVCGLWRGLRRPSTRRATQYLATLVVTLLLPCIVFFVTARYRLVAVPFLCVLAGMGMTELVSLWRSGRRQFWIASICVALVFTLTRLGGQTSVVRQAWENAQMAGRLYATGQLDQAISYQEAASRLQPQRLEILLNLALYRSERGDAGDAAAAEDMLQALAGRFPEHAVVLFNWASLLEQTGDPDTARRVYQRVLQLDPSFEAARQNLRLLENR